MYHADYCAQLIPSGGSILDIGSGRGKFLYEMARRGFRVFGAETNPEYIRIAGERFSKIGIPSLIYNAAAEKLPFSDNRFDFVNCSEVSEHMENPEKAYKEIYRVLKPEGKCYMSFQSRFCLYDYHYGMYFINWIPRRWAKIILIFLHKEKQDSPIIGRQRLDTMHAYTFRDLLSILEKIGFSATDIREEKIKKRFFAFSPPLLILYKGLLRPLYFNTYHLLLRKRM